MKIYKDKEAYFMNDNGTIVELTPNKDNYLKLPENSVNRVWVSCAKVEKAPNQCIDYGDIEKQPRTLGPRSESSKKLMDYATDEEKAIINDIIEKCKARKAADKPAPKTELQKAEAKLAKLEERVALLKAQQILNNN